MKKNPPYIFAAALGALTLLPIGAYSLSEATKNAPVQGKAPVQEPIERIVNDEAANNAFLAALYDAQISLNQRQAEESLENIATVRKKLDALHDSPDRAESDARESGEAVEAMTPLHELEEARYAGAKAVEIEFGASLMPEKAVAPLPEGNASYEKINDALDVAALKPGSIKNARIRYVTLNVDKKKIGDRLDAAIRAINKGSLADAQYDLLQIHRQALQDKGINLVPAQTRARDHIALARFMAGKAELAGARSALDAAEKALKELQNGTDDVASMSAIRNDLATLESAIDDRDPGLVDKIDKALDDWWKRLS